ncbi:MAG TPA: YceI family protein [Candidatus Limnocylindria bacterium]|nr:YceI family protein [Candidatus Limnocylindria bacterium]
MFWYIDPSHTQVNFSVKHMMVSTVRGRLGRLSGRLELDPNTPEKASFEIAADVKAIDTNDPRRDGHLRSADFFDAETYPLVTFKSDAVFPRGDGRYTASGDLTIRTVTRPVSFDIELVAVAPDGKGGRRLGATATTTIDRTDFGLTWNMPLPNGVLVGEKVKVEVDLEAIDEASAKTMGLAA